MLGNCILLLCGLPASGKSALLRNFMLSICREENSESLKCHEKCQHPCIISVTYDELIPLNVQRELVKTPDEWRKARLEILEVTEKLLRERMKLCDTQSTITSSPLYDELCSVNSHVMDCPPCPALKYLVIVDDNLYYSSMRYSWYQLARKLSSGFCQVWLCCPLPELERRNTEREGRVPEEVIRTMACREEPPNMDKNFWERHSLILDSTVSDSRQMLRSVWDLITRAALDPVKPIPEKETFEMTPSDINIADQILRKIVSAKVKEARGEGLNLAAHAQLLNSSRTSVLERLRTGVVRIPPFSENSTEDLEQFLLDTFISISADTLTNDTNMQ